ncbi:MAG: type II toxin-antitoxin system VapC family toxin [Acidobacteriota bacterium]
MPKSKSQQPTIQHAFWDASAIVPLCYYQVQTVKARQAYRIFPDMVVWWSTRVECASALYRLEREHELTGQQAQQSSAALEKYRRLWDEITPSDEVRTLAENLLRKHQLRAADSLQLAAALVWCNSYPKGRAFVCDDNKLLAAAEKEGFNVIHV